MPLARRGATLEREPLLEWIAGSPSSAELKRGRFNTFTFVDLRREFIEPARASRRPMSLANPADGLFHLLDANERMAVTSVPTRTNGDLQDVYGYLVEPAWRRGVHLRLYADRELDELRADEFVDPGFGYAWTLERLQYIGARATRQKQEHGLPPLTPIEYRLFKAMRAAGLSPVAQFGVGGPYRVDFAFPALQLAIEADGREWHDPNRDRRRDAALDRLGWSVMRFTGSEIVRDAGACAATIANRCAQLTTEPRYSYDLEEERKRSRVRGLLERLRAWLASLVRAPGASDEDLGAPDADETDSAVDTIWLRRLDESQLAAVRSHDGVVQVLAPAGSGKTRVLVARVQELISRGVPANRILCCTFNKEAKEELKRRFQEAGAQHVVTKSIHGAKGREWPWVILFGADADTLPHKKTLSSAPDEEARAAAFEDERRLAYVALTRARARLTILHREPKSQFICEAEQGFVDAQYSRTGFDEPATTLGRLIS